MWLTGTVHKEVRELIGSIEYLSNVYKISCALIPQESEINVGVK